VFVALGILHAKRIRHILICGLSGCTLFFPHYLINGMIFGEGGGNVIERQMYVLISPQLLSETFPILRRIE